MIQPYPDYAAYSKERPYLPIFRLTNTSTDAEKLKAYQDSVDLLMLYANQLESELILERSSLVKSDNTAEKSEKPKKIKQTGTKKKQVAPLPYHYLKEKIEKEYKQGN